jgi:hypothetical protein
VHPDGPKYKFGRTWQKVCVCCRVQTASGRISQCVLIHARVQTDYFRVRTSLPESYVCNFTHACLDGPFTCSDMPRFKSPTSPFQLISLVSLSLYLSLSLSLSHTHTHTHNFSLLSPRVLRQNLRS